MKILIFGSRGMLGSYIHDYLSQKTKHTIYTISREIFDITNINTEKGVKKLDQLFIDYKIEKNDVVINAAGMIKPTIKNDNILDAIKVNSIFPHKLQMVCSILDIKLIHITTDCVYSGKKGKYSELDLPDPIDTYGMTKFLGEPSEACVIRTSIIGEEKYNQRSLVEWVKNNKDGEINGFTNHEWNGVTCLELSKIINRIIKDNLFWEGIKHIHSDTVTKYELLNYINTIYDLHIKIKPIKADIPVNRTLTSLTHFLGIMPEKDIYTQIQEMQKWGDNENEFF